MKPSMPCFTHTHHLKNKEKCSQRGFSRARVDVGCGSAVVVNKVRDAVHSEPHLPSLGEGLVVQQAERSKWVKSNVTITLRGL